MIRCHDNLYHFYADNTELHTSCPLLKRKFSEYKMEATVLGKPSELSGILRDSTDFAGCQIPFASEVKSLGVTLDYALSMKQQIDAVCRACCFHIRQISRICDHCHMSLCLLMIALILYREYLFWIKSCLNQISRIRKFLSLGSVVKFVSCLVLSRLDYCNSLLAGVPTESINKLKNVHNCAARRTFGMMKRGYITPALKTISTGCIPLNEFITSCLFSTTSASTLFFLISDLLSPYTVSHTLHSASDVSRLSVPC